MFCILSDRTTVQRREKSQIKEDSKYHRIFRLIRTSAAGQNGLIHLIRWSESPIEKASAERIPVFSFSENYQSGAESGFFCFLYLSHWSGVRFEIFQSCRIGADFGFLYLQLYLSGAELGFSYFCKTSDRRGVWIFFQPWIYRIGLRLNQIFEQKPIVWANSGLDCNYIADFPVGSDCLYDCRPFACFKNCQSQGV